MPTYLNRSKEVTICIVVLLGLSLISLIYTLISLIPYVKSRSKSFIYFGSIAGMKKESFIEKFGKQNEAEIALDLSHQIHELSIGLKNKFYYLRIAGKLFVLEALFIIPLIYFVTKNLK